MPEPDLDLAPAPPVSAPAKLQFWSPAQRLVLITLILLMCGYLLVRLAFTSKYVSDPQPAQGARAAELQDKIDPNIADAQTLALLPNLGEKRAREIVAYREEFHRTRPGKVPFQSPDDLLKVKGIGVSAVESLTPYLSFPTTQPGAP
jgi:DNA uptake protein ComE-like DNA-binding protein